MTTEGSFKSKLVIAGVLLMLAGIFVPGPLEQFLASRFPMTLPLALVIDASKTTALWGLGLLVIGLLRERRAKKSGGTGQ